MVERSKNYQSNDKFNGCPACQMGVLICSRGSEFENSSLAPLTCSKPSAMFKNDSINIIAYDMYKF